MPTTTARNLELNPTGPSVDSDIRRYLGSFAGRNAERFCAPSLVSIASAAWTSPLMVKQHLESLEKAGILFPVVKEVDGEKVKGWFVPKRKRNQRPQTATGFTGGDKAFLRACGVAVGD